MLNHRRVFLMLAILVFTSQSPALTSQINSNNNNPTLDENLLAEFSEQQRLELAADNWHFANSEAFTGFELNSYSNTIHFGKVSFDPLIDEIGSSNLFNEDESNKMQDGLVVIQLHRMDSAILESLQYDYGFTILDFLSGESIVARLPENTIQSFEFLDNDERVRWIGEMKPDWRVSENIFPTTESNVIFMIPTIDLEIGGYEQLVLDLASYGGTDTWCGLTFCQSHVVTENIQDFILNVANDGRILWIERGSQLELHNSVAASLTGVVNVRNSATFTLDGSGEMLAIADTGLDRDHPDISGRVAAVYTQFGLDSSPIDSNTGHGTHVTVTAIGDGSGDSGSKGIAPAADVTMYALEHDPTGVFGRQGSIYDLLLDAKQKTARIAINAWGLNGNFGEYTSDSRSVDQFVLDEPKVLPIFSVGDRGANGASQISPPSTAKNVLSVGVSTTGTDSTASPGSVDSISSQGPTLDGRIKPDVVAPGIELCSGRAEEAKSPSGFSCGAGTHADGDPLYMSLSGTSQATAVAGGIASLTREYLREQVGLTSPSASLVKAAMINGATDLGTPDIPNPLEGWGEINLERTILPTDGSTILTTYFDDEKSLRSGFGLLYELSLDPSHGIDITLAWTDEAGSANSAQNQPKLINNLDLVLVDPSGNEWLGNDFQQGFSVQGGSPDVINNVERIKIAPGTYSNSGDWLVKVMHRGGSDQDYSIVITADATIQPKADLTVFNESIYLSSQNPLQNDIVSLRVAWMNQGTLDTNGFHWILEDLTEGTILLEGDSLGVASSEVESVISTRTFSNTGIHTLQLTIDSDNVIAEMNDETSGINNNIMTLDIEVTSLGVRVVTLNDDGTEPITPEERSAAAIKVFDVRNETGIDIPIRIKNEGTGTQSISLSVTNVQQKHPIFDYYIVPEDLWSKEYSENGPFSITGQGSTGDYKDIILHFEDEYANLDDPNSPRYARSGTFYVDVTVQYQSIPTVSHSQQLTIIIEQVDDANVVVAGTSGLAAEPGDSAAFSISAQNVGNSAAQYSVECVSQNRWQIMLGNSNSSTLDFEPLDISSYLSMPVRIFVPPVVDGLPSVGDTDSVTCYVTSFTDPSLNYSESVVISVLEKEEFKSNLLNNGLPVGSNLLTRDVLVDSGEEKYLEYEIINSGNSILDMEVSIQPSNPSWFLKVFSETENDSRKVSVTIQPGDTSVIQFQINVPNTALEGDSNSFTIRAEISDFNYITNTTRLIIKEDVSLDLSGPEVWVASISSDFSYNDFTINNTGNSVLTLNWSYSIPPDGWTVGFSNPVKTLDPREEATVSIGILPPANEEVSLNSFTLTVTVNADSSGRSISESIQSNVQVLESNFGNISINPEAVNDFIGIEVGTSKSQTISFRNDGNTILDASVVAIIIDQDGEVISGWEVSVTPAEITSLNPQQVVELLVEVKPGDKASKGSYQILINVTSEDDLVSQISISSSIQSSKGNSGLFNIVPWYVSLIIVSTLLICTIIFARKMKNTGSIKNDDSELVAADAYVGQEYISERRDAALDIGTSVNELTSGEVSQDEIAAALAQSMDLPALPLTPNLPSGMPPAINLPAGMPPAINIPAGMPPKVNIPAGMPPKPITEQQKPKVEQQTVLTRPLPASGLPAGWTIEQWNAYGNIWLERNQK